MATPNTQIIALPDIPELYDDNFLDILLPVRGGGPTAGRATTTPAAVNPVIEALIENSRRTFTDKGAPAYNSTGSAILDAFHNLSTCTLDVAEYLSKSWIEDPELTLHLIWSLRSVPDGKGLKETFYQCVYIVLDGSFKLFLHTFPSLKTGHSVGCINATPGLPSLIFISWLNPFVLLLRKESQPRPMAAGKIFLTYFALLP